MATSSARLSGISQELTLRGMAFSLAEIGAPMAACTPDGEVIGVSPNARAVLKGVGIDAESLPFTLPPTLWAELSGAPEGVAIEWHALQKESDASLGCSRYTCGPEHFIVLMKEVSAKRRELSRRLHQQRLESTGRLVASIAHDVRTALASILYNADFLSSSAHELPTAEIADTAAAIHTASRRLEGICAGLLGFAKLGPKVADEVSLHDVVARVCSLVRPMYRERAHELRSRVVPASLRVRGNAILIDQILVNLLVNAAEASSQPVHVLLECSPEPMRTAEAPRMVRICVSDDGPGVPEALRESIFHPFFTTHADGSGLGLTTAREAARDMGGDLILEPTDRGARFIALLLGGEPQASEAS